MLTLVVAKSLQDTVSLIDHPSKVGTAKVQTLVTGTREQRNLAPELFCGRKKIRGFLLELERLPEQLECLLFASLPVRPTGSRIRRP